MNKIYVVEPRRIAAKQPALTLKRLGYNVSFYFKGIERQKGLSGKIVFITDGMFLNIINEIKAKDVIILDEFHERNINMDLILAILKQKKHKNIIITSATLDKTFSSQNNYFNNFTEIEIKSQRNYPVEIIEKYIEDTKITGLTETIEKIEHFDGAIENIIATEIVNNIFERRILVFLSGYEIMKKVEKELLNWMEKNKIWKKIVLVHAQMSGQEDFNYLFNNEEAIILATNVAQISITPQNLDLVIISGYHKQIARKGKFMKLEEVPISISDMKQQIGRVGRTRPGKSIIINVLTNGEKFLNSSIPEIKRIPLENTILNLLGNKFRIENFDLLDNPPEENIRQAYNILKEKKLIEENYNLTEKGIYIKRLGIDIYFGEIIYNLRENKHLKEFLLIISILNNLNKLLYFNREKSEEINNKRKRQKEKFGDDDITLWINFIISFIKNVRYIDYFGNITEEGYEYLRSEFVKAKAVKEIIKDYEILYQRVFGSNKNKFYLKKNGKK